MDDNIPGFSRLPHTDLQGTTLCRETLIQGQHGQPRLTTKPLAKIPNDRERSLWEFLKAHQIKHEDIIARASTIDDHELTKRDTVFSFCI